MMATKKNYSQEFKKEAVELAQKNGNQTQTAQDLGIHLSVLRRWKKELEIDGHQAFPGKGHTKDEEFRQLQKENQRLKDTVEVLKKAVGMGSQPGLDLGSAAAAPRKIPVCQGAL
jgi:transposase